MAENRERLVSDILLDIAGHEEMLEFSRRKAQDGRGIAAYWEAHVCSHAAILRDLHKELSERTGEPTNYEPNVGELGIALVWHPKSERPDDESQILIDEGDGYGTAGTYYADDDMLAAAADGIASDWENLRMDRWAYISDLVPKKEKED
jgi:hypothetical protein